MSQFIEMYKDLLVNGKIEDLVDRKIASVKKSYHDSDEIEYIDISSIDNISNTIVETTKYEVSNAPSRAQQCVKKGDILVSTVRPINRNIAVVTRGLQNLVASTGFCVLRPKEEYREYLLSIVKSDAYTEHMCDKASGGLYPAVNNGDVFSYGIHIPNKELAQKVSTIHHQADKSEFVGFKSQFIEMFYNGKYTVDKLREHIDVIRGVSYKPSDVYETHNENTSIVLRSNNIEGGQINFDDLVYVSTERVSELQLLGVGDIVMCGSNGSKKLVGKAAMLQETPTIRTSFGAFCLGIRCKLTLVPEYLATYFQTSLYRDEIEQLGSGSNILNIKPDHIYDLEVPIPLYDEQMAFVSIVRQADKSEYYN